MSNWPFLYNLINRAVIFVIPIIALNYLIWMVFCFGHDGMANRDNFCFVNLRNLILFIPLLQNKNTKQTNKTKNPPNGLRFPCKKCKIVNASDK